jgi:hypothetical protein
MEVKKQKKHKIEEVVVEAIATDDGYYKGRIIRTGEKFQYDGITKNGRLPLWLKPVGAVKVKSKKVEKSQPVEADVSDLV